MHPTKKLDCSSFARCCGLLRPPCAATTCPGLGRHLPSTRQLRPAQCGASCTLPAGNASAVPPNGLDCAFRSLRAKLIECTRVGAEHIDQQSEGSSCASATLLSHPIASTCWHSDCSRPSHCDLLAFKITHCDRSLLVACRAPGSSSCWPIPGRSRCAAAGHAAPRARAGGRSQTAFAGAHSQVP